MSVPFSHEEKGHVRSIPMFGGLRSTEIGASVLAPYVIDRDNCFMPAHGGTRPGFATTDPSGGAKFGGVQ